MYVCLSVRVYVFVSDTRRGQKRALDPSGTEVTVSCDVNHLT